MVTDSQFDNLVDLCQDLANLVEKLANKVQTLEEIARHHENQIEDLRYEVRALNGTSQSW